MEWTMIPIERRATVQMGVWKASGIRLLKAKSQPITRGLASSD
jgi:hypothetical protein